MLIALLACAAPADPFAPVAPACEGSGASPTDRELRVRLGLPSGTGPAEVAPWTGRAAWLWALAGVRLRLDGLAEVDGAPVLGGDAGALRDAPEPEVVSAVLAPLVARTDAVARPAERRVELVFLESLAEPSSPANGPFAGLAGLTVSRPLLERVGRDPAADLLRAAPGLATPFTPTVFLALDELRRRDPDDAGAVVAHELGHALGLPHDPDAGSLMATDPARCVGPRLVGAAWP